MDQYKIATKSRFLRAKYRVTFNKLNCLINDCTRYLEDDVARSVRERAAQVKSEIYPLLSQDSERDASQTTIDAAFGNAHFKSQFYDHAPIGLFILNPSAGIIDFNKKAADYWGLTDGTFKGVSFFSLLDARFGIRLNQLLREVVHTREERSFDSFCRRIDGSSFYGRFHISIAMVGEHHNDIVLVSVLDISKELSKERIIRSIAKNASTEYESDFMTHLSRLLLAIEESGLVVIVIKENHDEASRVYWNVDDSVHYRELTGYDLPSLKLSAADWIKSGLPRSNVQKLLQALVPDQSQMLRTCINSYILSPEGDSLLGHISLFFVNDPIEHDLYQDILEIFAHRITQERIRYEYMRKEKTAKEHLERVVSLRTRALRSKAVRLEHEIEQRKDIETKLIEAKRKAESSNRAKSMFLANMSHEIRTPLNGILGIVSILKDTDNPKKKQEYIRIINQSGKVLLRIIDDILDLSRLESGQLQISPVGFNFRELLCEIYHSHIQEALRKDLDLRVFYPFNLSDNIFGDDIRIRQIIDNLVSNAIKYTDSGHVQIRVSVHKKDKGAFSTSVLAVEVKDTGPGMTSQQAQLVWRRFERLDQTTTRKTDGFGLGLAITKKLVNMMRGRVFLETGQGRGACFKVFLPLPIDSLHRDGKMPSRQLKPIVYVDSFNDERLSMLGKLLHSAGFRSRSVSSEEGPVAWTAGEALLLVDGLSYKQSLSRHLKHLQESEPVSSFRKIVVLTHIKRLLGSSNQNVHYVDPDCLIYGLTEVLSFKNELPQSHVQQTMAIFPGVRVLLAEDNLVNQQVSNEMLKVLGANTDIAVNGLEACELAMEHRYDLILMDCFMPELDGVEAMQRIRRQLVDVPPIIAVTANAIKGERERYLEQGFDGYLSKPFHIGDLRSCMREYLQPQDSTKDGVVEYGKSDRILGKSSEPRESQSALNLPPVHEERNPGL